MVLIIGCSFFMVFLTYAVLYLLILVKKSFVIDSKKTDMSARILILDVTLDEDQYILINLYNTNTETEIIKVLEEFHNLTRLLALLLPLIFTKLKTTLLKISKS